MTVQRTRVALRHIALSCMYCMIITILLPPPKQDAICIFQRNLDLFGHTMSLKYCVRAKHTFQVEDHSLT